MGGYGRWRDGALVKVSGARTSCGRRREIRKAIAHWDAAEGWSVRRPQEPESRNRRIVQDGKKQRILTKARLDRSGPW